MEFFYGFENASPYIEKFGNVMQKIHESGYLHMPFLLNNTPIIPILSDFGLTNEDIVTSYELWIIFFIGNACAAFLFIVEATAIFPKYKKSFSRMHPSSFLNLNLLRCFKWFFRFFTSISRIISKQYKN